MNVKLLIENLKRLPEDQIVSSELKNFVEELFKENRKNQVICSTEDGQLLYYTYKELEIVQNYVYAFHTEDSGFQFRYALVTNGFDYHKAFDMLNKKVMNIIKMRRILGVAYDSPIETEEKEL